MNPAKVDRSWLNHLQDLPNIGPAMAWDLRQLGFQTPDDLVGQDPYAMYERLCKITGVRQDPCVLDIFISVTRFMTGDPPRPWWYYTEERKQRMRQL